MVHFVLEEYKAGNYHNVLEFSYGISLARPLRVVTSDTNTALFMEHGLSAILSSGPVSCLS